MKSPRYVKTESGGYDSKNNYSNSSPLGSYFLTISELEEIAIRSAYSQAERPYTSRRRYDRLFRSQYTPFPYDLSSKYSE